LLVHSWFAAAAARKHNNLTTHHALHTRSAVLTTNLNSLPAAGYDEAAATPTERLLAHTLQEVLLLHSPPGSSIYPVAVDEDDASDTQLDGRWPKSTLKLVLQAAQQPYRVNEFKQHLAGEACIGARLVLALAAQAAACTAFCLSD
jgi:hypothetical protein